MKASKLMTKLIMRESIIFGVFAILQACCQYAAHNSIPHIIS